MIILCLAILTLLFWIGYHITGALLTAIIWLCVKLPCAIIVCCFGIVCCVLVLLSPHRASVLPLCLEYSYIIAANIRKGGRELVLPAVPGYMALCENQFCIYDLHSSVSDAVHLSDPFHLVAGFQFFRIPSAFAVCFASRRKSSSACRSISARYSGSLPLVSKFA